MEQISTQRATAGSKQKRTFLEQCTSPKCLLKLFMFAVLLNVVKALSAVALVGLAYQPDYNTCRLIKESLSLPCMEHTITTTDGYILSLKRVGEEFSENPPVLLIHGFMDSSATFAISGRNESLTGLLYDSDFDVWLLDKRGRAPWRHEEFKSQSGHFWDFSLDEIIEEDIPAAVRYIRRLTGKRLASVIGHSQGGAAGLASLSEDEKVAESVKSFVGLASPLDYPMGGSFLKSIMLFSQSLALRLAHPGIISAASRLVMNGLANTFPGIAPAFVCILGCESRHNLDTVPDVFGYYPREDSYKRVQHVMQMERAKLFQKFDHGKVENLKRYGQEEPKAYDFSSIKTPVALFYGKYDVIATIDEKTSIFLKQLPRESLKILNTTLPFGHADFVWGRSAKYHLYPKIVRFIHESSDESE
mmetsp:Transcript_1223/g.1450  ORF Transcript_1223/g.1450 Transcript_1223/m.1450 type:complete len:417 (-) Transcript_1223:1060-2310(-)|eukprot:CAMPEP_0184013874 /NCGR_PEP_ID=MMETSP0954-20121128/5283_1 /TAXON_ID=627963 /ORGANISM="Aplanochytrium sp, Strain PBS07" /LENGTH=416 /DNA_ID=CAMNT_0026294167 /DNA_START=207 /DNA_END=1457 /DNA_ORIENTATION=-